MSRKSVREYAEAIRSRYLAANRKGQARMLDEFCATTGYHRKAAIRLLRRPLRSSPPKRRRGRPPRSHSTGVVDALHKVWEASGRLGSKRLAPFLPELVAALEAHRELVLTDEERAELLGLRPSAIDQLLRPNRRVVGRRHGGHPPTTASIRRQVPIRTWSEWKEAEVGSVQADLVEHCGESASGFYLYTLTVVEVTTGWTECRPVWGKAMQRVQAALHRIRGNLPMGLKALHIDNGGEFINHELTAYCREKGIPFTGGRPYRKNDQAYVEQRNWTAVRQLTGYARCSSRAAYEVLEELYEAQWLYANFFQPICKLVSKQRLGARVTKRIDQAATPYRRLLATGGLEPATARKLERLHRALNPVRLRARTEQLERELWERREREEPSVNTKRSASSPGNRIFQAAAPVR